MKTKTKTAKTSKAKLTDFPIGSFVHCKLIDNNETREFYGEVKNNRHNFVFVRAFNGEYWDCQPEDCRIVSQEERDRLKALSVYRQMLNAAKVYLVEEQVFVDTAFNDNSEEHKSVLMTAMLDDGKPVVHKVTLDCLTKATFEKNNINLESLNGVKFQVRLYDLHPAEVKIEW